MKKKSTKKGKKVASKLKQKITWKKIDKNQWEALTPKYDFYITKGKDFGYIVDVFDAKIKDKDDAYIESFQYDSLTKAKKETALYI